jgi:hypothetical protein
MIPYTKFDFESNPETNLIRLLEILNSHYDNELNIIKEKYFNFAPKDYSELGSLLTFLYFDFKSDLNIAFRTFQITDFQRLGILDLYQDNSLMFRVKTDKTFNEVYPLEEI